ncbi:hypothetical protein NQ318_023495 [Aromia moschata]|uniref:DUF8040 domain-containing protein n=1 Tax=Aromia moschata TaxID=1265417 RepID=A0AAV8YQV9_9CUCU|nr:hypothetical protein NQ318_023495 [Aromia moschata]
MEFIEKVKVAAAVIVINNYLKQKKRNRKRRQWVTPIFRSRSVSGGRQFLNDIFIGNKGQFENFCRMSFEDFEILLNLIEPVIKKQDTNYRESISPKEILAVTLRFLATGDSFTSLMYLFKISKKSISTIVIEVCRALNEALKHQVETFKCLTKFCNMVN